MANETIPTGLKSVKAEFYIAPDNSTWQFMGVPYNWQRVARYVDLDLESLNRKNSDNLDIAAVSKLSSKIVYDDFDTVDQQLNGRVCPTGQTWKISGDGPNSIIIKDRTVINQGFNYYASLDYGQPIPYMQGVFSYVTQEGGINLGSAQCVLIAQRSDRNLLTMLHAEFTYLGWSLRKRLNNPLNDPSNVIGGGSYNLVADGTQYHCGMRIIKGEGSIDTVIIDTPDGNQYSFEYTDMPTLELTTGTWQVQTVSPSSAVYGRWHHVSIGEKKIYKDGILKGGVTPAEVAKVAGYGYGKRNSKKFKISSTGWYRIAYNTNIQGFTIQGRLTLSTIGIQPSHFKADIFARSGASTRINTTVNYGGYHLSQVRVGTNSDSAYVDVYIQNVEGNTVNLFIDAEGFVNLYPVLIPTIDIPTSNSIVNIATPQVTSFSGSTVLDGWNRIATQRSGAGGLVMYGIVRIKAIDAARFVNMDILISANATSVLQPIQILSNTGSTNSPISQLRLSRNSTTQEIALDINCPFANVNALSIDIEYIGTFTIPSSLVIATALTTEEQVLALLVNRQNIRRVINYLDRDETQIYLNLANNGSYTIGNNESVIYQDSGLSGALTLTLPTTPVNGQTIIIGTKNKINTLTVLPNTGQNLTTSIYSLPGGQILTFRYRASNATWYLIQNITALNEKANLIGSNIFTGGDMSIGGNVSTTGTITANNNIITAGKIISNATQTSLAAKTATFSLNASVDNIISAVGSMNGLVPSGAPIIGQQFTVKNNGTGTITLIFNGSETLDGSVNYIILSGESITIASLGSVGWTKISNLSTTSAITSNVRGGRYFISGNGVTLSYSIPHNKTGVSNATAVSVEGMNPISGTYSSVTLTSTDVVIVFTTAPPTGTNNLEFSIILLN